MITVKCLLLASIVVLPIDNARASGSSVSHDAEIATTAPINAQTVEMLTAEIGRMRQKEAGYLDFTHSKLSDPPPSGDLILRRFREGLRSAASPQDVADVSAFCADSIEANSYAERNAFMVQAINSLKAGRINETNAALARVNELADLDQRLSELTCKK